VELTQEWSMARETQIALISRSTPDLSSWCAAIQEQNSDVNIRVFLTLDSVSREINRFKFDIFLIRVPYFTINHTAVLKKIHQTFPNISIITIATEINPSAQFQIRTLNYHKLLLEPNEMGDLSSVIQLMKNEQQRQTDQIKNECSLRLHPRLGREGEVEIIDHSGRRISAKFIDIAQMGARVVIQTRDIIHRTTRVRVEYPSLSEPGKVHRIESVVIWNKISGGLVDSVLHGPSQTLGLRFIAAL
jgi:DNA-binding NtrC family response regulator